MTERKFTLNLIFFTLTITVKWGDDDDDGDDYYEEYVDEPDDNCTVMR